MNLTRKHAAKAALLVLAVLIALSISGCRKLPEERYDIADAFMEAAVGGNFELTELTDFDWDTACVIGQYVDVQQRL